MHHHRYVLLLLAVLTSQLLVASTPERIRVACVGNSITYGYGLSDPLHDSYPAQLQQLLGDWYEVGNFGKSGATLLRRGHRPYIDQEEFRRAMAFAGDIVIIHLGINDTDPRDWPNYRDDFVEDYAVLIDSLRSANPQARIVVARLSPISDRHHRFRSGTRNWQDEIQAMLPQVAALKHTELIDFHAPLYSRPDLLPDGLHPNREGARLLAETVYRHVTGCYGGLRMAPVYGDSMVVQRDTPLTLRGWADAGERVRVSMAGHRASMLTGQDGRWEVTLPALPAGGPHTLTVRASSRTLTFRDVLVGEVWICSGQSNMAFLLRQSEEYRQGLVHLDSLEEGSAPLRLFNRQACYPTDNVSWDSLALARINQLDYLSDARWTACTSATAPSFSAVAYYFGCMLRDSLQVPVGLIHNAVGGATTESWIDRCTLEHAMPEILTDWLSNDFIQEWCRGRARTNIAEALARPASWPYTPQGECLQRHPYQPCYLFEAGIEPLDHYGVRGVIWYQGESNAHNKDAHARLFPLLLESWREYWQQPDMPLLFVQLSSLNRPSWPWFRDSQRRLAEALPHVGMAVTTDVGDSTDVHPRRKQPVGERLVRLALSDVYRQPFFAVHPSAASGPTLRRVEVDKEGILVLHFDHAEGLTTSDGLSPRTFEVGDGYGRFFAAQARIEDGQVRLTCPDVYMPASVRYGWQPFTRANLVNGFALPASTFLFSLPPVVSGR